MAMREACSGETASSGSSAIMPPQPFQPHQRWNIFFRPASTLVRPEGVEVLGEVAVPLGPLAFVDVGEWSLSKSISQPNHVSVGLEKSVFFDDVKARRDADQTLGLALGVPVVSIIVTAEWCGDCLSNVVCLSLLGGGMAGCKTVQTKRRRRSAESFGFWLD